MEKKEIRKQLKHNFLKNLIYRIDYQGLIDCDVDDYVKSIREKIYDRGYTNLEEVYMSHDDQENQREFVFKSVNGKELNISKTRMIVEIDTTKNETLFSKYMPLIIYLIKELNKLQYVHIQMIGLRKVNCCIVYNEKDIATFFTNKAIALFSNKTITSHFGEEMVFDDMNVKYNRSVTKGRILKRKKEQEAYQIILDIEGTTNIQKKISYQDIQIILKNINDKIYEFYIDSLTD